MKGRLFILIMVLIGCTTQNNAYKDTTNTSNLLSNNGETEVIEQEQKKNGYSYFTYWRCFFL